MLVQINDNNCLKCAHKNEYNSLFVLTQKTRFYTTFYNHVLSTNNKTSEEINAKKQKKLFIINLYNRLLWKVSQFQEKAFHCKKLVYNIFYLQENLVNTADDIFTITIQK